MYECLLHRQSPEKGVLAPTPRMSSAYECDLQRQSPEKKQTKQEGDEVQSKRAGDDQTPRFKLKLQRYFSEETESSPQNAGSKFSNEFDNGDETPIPQSPASVSLSAGGPTSKEDGEKTPASDGKEIIALVPAAQKQDSLQAQRSHPPSPNSMLAEEDCKMLDYLFSTDAETKGTQELAVPVLQIPELPPPMPTQCKVNITMRADFDLRQECAAVDCHLAGKTPEQALHAILTLLDCHIPPEDAALLGLVLEGDVSTKASVDDTVAAARACVADMRSGEVHIRVDKRKRADHNYNVHFACKCHGMQVGSYIFKPHDNEPASFHQGAAIRIALAWRCIPLLSKQNIVDLQSAAVGMELSAKVNTWLKDDGWLSMLAHDE